MAETELTFAAGFDAWVLQNNPGANRSGGDAVRLQSGERKGIVQIPVTGLRGKTVVSATLYGHVRDGWAAQTVTAHLLAGGIDPSTVTWEDLPANVPGVSGAVTTGALSAGATIAIPVDDIAQAIADGAKNHGFVLTTSAAAVNVSNLRSFTSGKTAWVLVVGLSDAPDKPSNQRPNDGAVSHAAPKVAWDTSDHVSIQVQVDPDADGVSPAYDSGTQTSDDDVWDLSVDGDFTPLGSGDSTQWRVRVSDGTSWSPWSDWASFTYTPKPTLVMDSPTGGTIGDPTFSVLAHLSSGVLRRYRIRVAKGADRTAIVYDSGERPPDGSTIARDIPWRDPDSHRRIVKGDDTDWLLNVRAEDSVGRAVAVGDPVYIETWVPLTFDDDVNEPPADYTVTPATSGSPVHVHSWTRSEAAESWLIMHGSDILARLDLDDVDVDAGTYTWNDGGLLQPYRPTELHVRAVDAGSRSVASNHVTVTSQPLDVWIVLEDGTAIRLRGNVIDGFTKRDRRTTFKPLNVDTDVDIVYGYEGVSGSFEGRFDSRNPTTPDVLAAVDQLEDLRRTPTARPRLIWATQSIRAQLKNLSALPSSLMQADTLKHHVTFDFIQDGD